MSSGRQPAYEPLPKGIEEFSGTAPPPAYEQRQPSQAAPQITVAPNVHMNASLTSGVPVSCPPVGPSSMEITCPHCRSRIKTRIRHRSTSKTYIACLLLTWTLCCCCLPFCMDSCRNANHFCPMCGAFVGTYHS